jgi:hypothetical protein
LSRESLDLAAKNLFHNRDTSPHGQEVAVKGVRFAAVSTFKDALDSGRPAKKLGAGKKANTKAASKQRPVAQEDAGKEDNDHGGHGRQEAVGGS